MRMFGPIVTSACMLILLLTACHDRGLSEPQQSALPYPEDEMIARAKKVLEQNAHPPDCFTASVDRWDPFAGTERSLPAHHRLVVVHALPNDCDGQYALRVGNVDGSTVAWPLDLYSPTPYQTRALQAAYSAIRARGVALPRFESVRLGSILERPDGLIIEMAPSVEDDSVIVRDGSYWVCLDKQTLSERECSSQW